jgi:hypothetical protein
VYTTGRFLAGLQVADFDPDPAVIYDLQSHGFRDAFVSKLDAEGTFVWAKSLGGPSEDGGSSISTDRHGNVYVSGYFKETAEFFPGPTPYNLTTVGARDAFVLKCGGAGSDGTCDLRQDDDDEDHDDEEDVD